MGRVYYKELPLFHLYDSVQTKKSQPGGWHKGHRVSKFALFSA